MRQRTSTKTQALVLWNMRHNLENAKTRQMREFYQHRLEAYERELGRRCTPTNNPFARFVDKLEHAT